MANPIIQVQGVNKEYGRGKKTVAALKDINLEIQPGDFVAVVGPSGCGKSTLLHVMAGLEAPTNGRILIDGVDVTLISERDMPKVRAQKIGFVFQFYNLFPMLTAFENVEFPLLLAKRPRRQREERIWSLLDLVGMRNRSDHRPDELSGGEQQRVGIARALACNPALVLADEPTGDLDSENAKAFMELVRKLNEVHNQTFIIVTHDPIVSQRCDNVYTIRDGEISKPE
jgi:putative ABC transport system ATP-binding protein